MDNSDQKTFIPKKWPKSIVVAMLAGLFSLFVAGPIMLVGHLTEIKIISNLGWGLFLIFWFVFITMFITYWLNAFKGKYNRISEKDWSDQLW